METRAPFVIVGAFVLAAAVAVFGFVYWLHTTGGVGKRTVYHVQFNGPVPGLLVGAAVLFNGIRVGEVTQLALAPDSPRQVNATIAVGTDTPVRADTKVGLDFQGLTGVPVIALEGGAQLAANGEVPTLVAEPGAGQSMTQAARDALRRVDTVLSDNADPLKNTIANLETFSGGLARNTGRIDSILSGVEKMTGGGTPPVPKAVYDLRVPEAPALPKGTLKQQLMIAEPTALVMFETQRILITPSGKDYPGFAEVQWADTIPKLLQAKLMQAFENFDIAHPPLRAQDSTAPEVQLQLDLREFAVSTEPQPIATIALSAKLLDKNGHLIAAQLFSERRPLAALTPPQALAAFDDAFVAVATKLIGWTAAAL